LYLTADLLKSKTPVHAALLRGGQIINILYLNL